MGEQTFRHSQMRIIVHFGTLERQQKRSVTTRRNFAASLDAFEEDLRAGLPTTEVANLMRLTQSRMDVAARLPDQDKAATALIRAEHEAIIAPASPRVRRSASRPALPIQNA